MIFTCSTYTIIDSCRNAVNAGRKNYAGGELESSTEKLSATIRFSRKQVGAATRLLGE